MNLRAAAKRLFLLEDLRWPAGSDVGTGFFDGFKNLVALPRVAPLAAQDEFCLVAFRQLALWDEVILRWPTPVVIPGDGSEAVGAGVRVAELNIAH